MRFAEGTIVKIIPDRHMAGAEGIVVGPTEKRDVDGRSMTTVEYYGQLQDWVEDGLVSISPLELLARAADD